MAEEILNKEIAEKLMAIKGEARGVHFVNDYNYLIDKWGEAGVKKVEFELENVGAPIKYKEVRNMDFYPAGLRAISLLAIKKTFQLDDKGIYNLCQHAAAISMIVKLYMKFFYSIDRVLEKIPKIWDDYFTEGTMAVKEHNEKEKQIILRIENLDLDPTYCRCLEGFFCNLAKMIGNNKNASCREIKCVFSGADGHEFLINY